MTGPAIPLNADLRIVGDVHGDAAAFAYAAATDRFVVQLGDLTDHGPDSAGALRIMFDLIDRGRGLFILGNHDLKLARALAGQAVRIEAVVQTTIEQLDEALRARLLREVERAPAWMLRGSTLFVHGGFHPAMLTEPAKSMLFSLGIAEEDVLVKCHQGLISEGAVVTVPEAGWVIRRLAELLDWEHP